MSAAIEPLGDSHKSLEGILFGPYRATTYNYNYVYRTYIRAYPSSILLNIFIQDNNNNTEQGQGPELTLRPDIVYIYIIKYGHINR